MDQENGEQVGYEGSALIILIIILAIAVSFLGIMVSVWNFTNDISINK